MFTRSRAHRDIIVWEIAGTMFILAAGSLLHFVYVWSGYADIVSLFAPVNESIWEHLKLGFWPLIVWSVCEFAFIRRKVNNFFPARLAGSICLSLFIVIVYYTYTFFTGKPILAVDISSFVAGTALCQTICLVVYFRPPARRIINAFGAGGLALIALCFAVFTHATPRLGIFRDRPHGAYGPVKTTLPE
jgi:hypothetical protein